MTAKNYTQTMQQEEIMDNLTDKTDKEQQGENLNIDQEKLAQLKAKLQSQKESKTEKVKKSLQIGIVGSGQAGSKIGQAFYKLGYDCVVMNTAEQDLKFIDIPESNKLFLDFSLGGAAKDINLGAQATEAYRDKIANLIDTQLCDAQVLLFVTSLGGGSGAGSVNTMVDILSSTGKPLMLLAVLPMDSDDTQTKLNALETLSRLSKFVQQKKVQNLIVVDNARIEVLYKDVGQMEFFDMSNRVIVSPIDIFNTMSTLPSNYKSLDPMELSKLFIDSEGLSIYGEVVLKSFEQDTDIAEAIINNVSNNLLASGFDIKQSKYVGFIVIANKKVWEKIPSISINYAGSMIGELCTSPIGIYKGVYEVNLPEDVVKIYSWFSGLGLPAARVDQLKQETDNAAKIVKEKNSQRNVNLTLETKEESIDMVQKVKDKIAQKSSAFGKFTQNVVDKRKK